MISYVCTALVGAVFLFSSAVKANDSRTFVQDLARYRLLGADRLAPAAVLLTGLEGALGMALLLHVYPLYLVPLSIVALAVLAGLTLWGERERDLEDCGCYGGVVLLTPKQSAALDLLFIALLATALALPAADAATPAWTLVLVGLTFAAGAALAVRSRQKPLVDLSRVQKGRAWRRSWLPKYRLDQGGHFLVFMSKSCPYCKAWVPILNVMHTQQDFPRVLGVMSLTDEEEVAAFRREHLIRFEVAQMDALLFRQMVTAYPTAVLVEDGVIKDLWEGAMPEPYVKRVKMFYDSIAVQPPASSAPRRAGSFSG